jgi:CheY-like chemotaxis protein
MDHLLGTGHGDDVLTALVVDDEPDARRRVAALLRLGGWQVREAAGAMDALRQAAVADFDLVVTDVSMPGEDGPSMLRRMRRNGSRARFLVVTSDPTEAVRAASVTAGAMACLAKPVEAGVLLDFLRSRTTGLAAQGEPGSVHEVDDLHDDLDAELLDRLQEMYASALPGRLSAIARSTTSGDAPGVVSAAHTLAGTSGQLGHPEVASICRAIAADARRGVMAHARVVELQALALAG